MLYKLQAPIDIPEGAFFTVDIDTCKVLVDKELLLSIKDRVYRDEHVKDYPRKEEIVATNAKTYGDKLASEARLLYSGDTVNHPSHYNTGKIEVIEFIEDQKLGFNRGNAVKYISRAGKKDFSKEIEDLSKAIWYVQREIELLRSRRDGVAPVRPNEMTNKVER